MWGTVRPGVVLYEENLYDNIVNGAIDAIFKANLAIHDSIDKFCETVKTYNLVK